MHDYPLHLDPFERRHVGKNGAFVFRVNHAHVARCVATLRPNMGQVYDKPVCKLKLISSKRKAA